jgi:hypothetical protein
MQVTKKIVVNGVAVARFFLSQGFGFYWQEMPIKIYACHSHESGQINPGKPAFLIGTDTYNSW